MILAEGELKIFRFLFKKKTEQVCISLLELVVFN
jgi:hypothetical protein